MKDRFSAVFFYSFIGFVYLLIVLKAVCVPVERMFLKQYHLAASSFPQWAITQIVPSMYNFANEFYLTQKPILSSESLASLVASDQLITHAWFNHYPLRQISFGLYRAGLFFPPVRKFIYLRSRYRDQEFISAYTLETTSRGLVVKPLPIISK